MKTERDVVLSAEVEAQIREAAKPWLRSAMRLGLVVGFVLGVVAVCIVLAVAGGGR